MLEARGFRTQLLPIMGGGRWFLAIAPITAQDNTSNHGKAITSQVIAIACNQRKYTE
jgi:hypothetical protein